MTFSYKYPRPALTVDIVVLGVNWRDRRLESLLIKRKLAPFKGRLALPGGFVNLDESLEAAALRELKEETGIVPAHLEQLATFGAVKRDPRERVVSVAYMALETTLAHIVKAGTDASDAAWYPARDLPNLAFDHAAIMATALARLEGKVRYSPIGFGLLPEVFSVGELRTLYEIVLGRPIDVSNFRRKISKFDFLVSVPGHGRPHYRFDEARYRKAHIAFEI
jgi:8-oxo-dGTP diphosphatase